MGNTYVVADIHGRRDAFYEMLDKINFKADDKMYILGDVLDRGPDGLKLLLEIMDMKNVEMIIGNHEQMALEYFKNGDFDNEEATFWRVVNGGQATYEEWRNLTNYQQEKVINFIEHLPTHKIFHFADFKYCLVHAGLIPMRHMKVEELIKQQENKLTWVREQFFQAKTEFEDATVIAGHTPTECIDPKFKGRIWYKADTQDRFVIDCGAEVLGCLRFGDWKEFYIKTK